ncbi:HlyD family efflux transporter periplasmic adaptor subunit [bacterium]|nr:HlyD family efflux transporter periplasmic adaptor subunit [bacterium]
MSEYARLRSDLIESPSEIEGETLYTIKDPVTGRFFRLRAPEHWLIHQLDGVRSPEQVASLFNDKFGAKLGAAEVEQFIAVLGGLFFLEDQRSEQELARASGKAFAAKTLFGRLLYFRFKAFKPGRFLDRLADWYRPFHRPLWFLLASAVILFGFGVMFANAREFVTINVDGLLTVGRVLTIMASLFILIVCHEFAHALACRYYGGSIREMGFMLMYFQPCFYCDVSDAWLFPKKSHRMIVTLAGPFFQLLLTALAVLVWRVTVPGTLISEVSRIIVIVSSFSYLFNFNPLIKLDGYYLLSDSLEISNLRSKSFAYFSNVIKRIVLGWDEPAMAVTPRERRIYLSYAVLALVYSGFLIGIAVYLLGWILIGAWGGAGLLLLAAVVLYILRQQIVDVAKGLVTHIRFMRKLLSQPIRLTIHIIVLAALLVLLIWVPFPYRVSGEVSVRPIATYQLSMTEYGLIEGSLRKGGFNPDQKFSILQMNNAEMGVLELVPIVKDGQVVMENDTIAMLTSNQVVQEISSAEAELGRLQGELDLLRAPPKKEQVQEAESELAAARADYEKRRSDVQRAEELFRKNLISSEELENKRSTMKIALADWQKLGSSLDLLKSPPRPEEETVLVRSIDKQKARLQFLRSQGDAQVILAPFSGVVSRNPNDATIMSVIDDNPIELLVPVNDFDISRVNVDQVVKLKVRSYPHRVFEGRVVRVPEAATVVDDHQYFPVTVVVDNSDGALADGMTGYAKIETGKTSLLGLLYYKFLSKIRVEFWSWW